MTTNNATLAAIHALRARVDIPLRRLTAAGCFAAAKVPFEPGGLAAQGLKPRSMRMFAISMAALGLFCAALASAVPAAAQTPPTTPATVSVYAKALRKVNPQLPKWQSQDLARRVLANAERWSLDANMLVAVVTVESHWHTHAVSRAGAIGLGQLMPGTAAKLGVDPHNAGENLSGAARYLSGLMQRFGAHYDLVFAAYNAGPKAVANYGGIPPYGETQQYVVRVMNAWQYFAKTIHLPQAGASNGAPDLAYWLESPAK